MAQFKVQGKQIELKFFLVAWIFLGLFFFTSESVKAEATRQLTINYNEHDFDIHRSLHENRMLLSNNTKTSSGLSVQRCYICDMNGLTINDAVSEPVAGEKYLLAYHLKPISDCDWTKEVSEYGFTKVEQISNFKVFVNGVERSDVFFEMDYYGTNIVCYIPVNPSTEGYINSIYVGNRMSLELGGSQMLSAEVNGTAQDKRVSWSLTGAKSSNTKVNQDGILQIDRNESAEQLTVRATSVLDSRYYGEMTVVITKEKTSINGFTVVDSTESVKTGGRAYVLVEVTGTQLDKTVIWKLEGATAADTTLKMEREGDYEEAVVNVSKKETAERLVLTFWPRMAPSKKEVRVIRVEQKEKAARFDFICNDEKIAASVGTKISELLPRVYDNLEDVQGNAIIKDESYAYYHIVCLDEATREEVEAESRLVEGKKYWITFPTNVRNTLEQEFAAVLSEANSICKVSELEGVCFYMNGRQTENAYVRMDEKMSGACYVYIPLKIYDREVEITEARIALEKGGQYHFQTKLYGAGNDDTISWSVEGNFSNETSVDSQGILKIGLDETAKTLIVKAALDGQKEPSNAEVIVYDEPPVITEVKIVSGPTEAFPKDVVSFTAEAIGTHLDKSVIWAIKGNSSPDTYISKDGVLTIASNERASSLKVIAKANKNPEILCEKEISIETASEIKLVNIGFDQKTFDFTTAKSPNELNASVVMRLYSMTPEVVVPKTASALETQKYVGKEEYDLLDSIGLDQNRKCRIRCIVDPANSNGFYWPEEVKALKEEVEANTLKAVTVLVNGEKREDVTVEYRADRFFLYIPIGKPACGSTPRLIKTPATCRAEGKESYYHCSDCGKNFWDFGKKKEITDLSVLKKLPMAAHSYGEGTLTKSPTKTQSGEKTYTCKVCGKTKTESVPALAKDNKKVIKDTKTKDSFVVLSVKKKSGTVIYQKPKNKNVKTVTIPERIKVKGITYNVVGIEKNAFAGCKKLKTIQIQSKKLTKKNIEKGAFNGLKKSTVIKVPKKKLKAYAAMFRQKGLTKSVKIK